MKNQVTFTHTTAIKELHRFIRYARHARKLNCFNVMHEEYDRAKSFVAFFHYHDLFSEEEYDRFWDEIVEEQYNNKEVSF